MTKRELVKWLERKQTEATDAAVKEYYATAASAKETVLHDLGFEECAAEMQEHIEKAYDIWVGFQKKCEEVDGFAFRNGYESPSNQLYDYVGDAGKMYRNLSAREIKLKTPAMQEAEAAHKAFLSNIKRNYRNVIVTVQNCKTAKDAAAYLTKLGFDLSELDNIPSPVTALAAQVDTSYLFFKAAA